MVPTEQKLFKNHVKSLEIISHDLNNILEKYKNFKLQLITISGATFSIYLALKNTTPSNMTRWGFIFLAASLVCGLSSIIFSFLYSYWNLFFKIFDIEKDIFNEDKSDEFKKEFSNIGWPEPATYDIDDLKFESKKFQIGLNLMRKFFTLTSFRFSMLFGVGQLLCFLIATILLLTGFILLP